MLGYIKLHDKYCKDGKDGEEKHTDMKSCMKILRVMAWQPNTAIILTQAGNFVPRVIFRTQRMTANTPASTRKVII